MKVAIIHDFLNQKIGGAEYVFFELANIYPEADLYALTYNKKKFTGFLNNRKVMTSSLQKNPFKKNPKYLLPFIEKAIAGLDFSNYDLVISSSTAWVKNIKITGKTKHLCYCYSPARMLWDSWPRYLDDLGIGKQKRFLITKIVSDIRLWDFYASGDVTQFIAISNYVKKRINKFYRRSARVIYPPVNVANLKPTDKKDNYYLILSVLSKYKNIELAIKAFKISAKRLIIAGGGPDKQRLEKLAFGAKNIVFYGPANEASKVALLSKAKGFIFPSIEDFGITPVEAMASATPVIALRGGGLTETMIDGKTGVFFDQGNPDCLNQAIRKAEKINLRTEDMVKQAAQFDRRIFAKAIKKAEDNLIKTDVKTN
ncbi:MAG: glycosyltransferase [bacterium]|nr:glycosyltransferase [bacterium]